MESQAPDSKTGETSEAGAEGATAPVPDAQAETAVADQAEASVAQSDAAGEGEAAVADEADAGAPAGGDAPADAEAPAEGDAPAEPEASSRLKWYAVHTYSGHENKARLALLDRIKNAGLQDKFGEVLIPTESVVEMVKGKRRTTTRKFYPGYMFVQMDMDDLGLHLVKNTPKITGFLGGNTPVPVKDDEIAGINRQMTEGAAKPTPKISFDEGENIRVVEGPFSNFTGIVEEVRPEKQRVRVLVSIFGRATPVELDFMQVEKA